MSSNIKFTRLGEHPESPARRPCLMFLGIVGMMCFFVLYMTYSADVSANTAEYELSLLNKRSNATTTAAAATPINITTTVNSSEVENTTDAPVDDYFTKIYTIQLDNPPIPKITNTTNLYDLYAIYTKKCRIREYNFAEPSLLKKYFSGTPKMCPKSATPFVFYPDLKLKEGYSCIAFDDATFGKHYKDFAKWKCNYTDVTRDTSHSVIDRYYSFSKPLPLKIGDCPKKEFLWITCNIPGNKIYEQPLMLPIVKPVSKPLTSNNIGKKPLHVLVVGLDSVSRLNAHRQFPKTLKYLNSKPNLIELFGYNKIGLNSAPNQIPLLSGIMYRDGPHAGLSERVGKNYFDNLTRYIWDDYEERGYRTMFYEEQWVYGLFVYSSLYGFKEAPTTYWPRPMMQAIDRSKLKAAGSGGWCIGPDFPAKHYLDYTYNTMKILGDDRPLFSYSWLSETAHDDVNGGHRVDQYFLDFFTKMDKDGILNNTAVFFISDHGFRFGSFRKTAQGGYEDMLPYAFVLMPDSYYKENPQALANIKENSRRLVTVYDMHTTLLELADAWSEGRTIRTTNGYSLFSTVIPSERNCADADINFQFCSCFEPQPYDRSGELSKSLAKFVVDDINSSVTKNNATTKCHHWEIDTIDDFSRMSEGDHWTRYFKISVKTKPSAQFEVTAEFQPENQTWKFLSSVDRTDWFSSHAVCVKGSSYERYCYCK